MSILLSEDPNPTRNTTPPIGQSTKTSNISLYYSSKDNIYEFIEFCVRREAKSIREQLSAQMEQLRAQNEAQINAWGVKTKLSVEDLLRRTF